MTVPPLLILGNVNVDLVLGEVDGWPAIGTEVVVERSEMRAGGSAGNTALALTGLGVPHRLVSSIGRDPNGLWLRSQFDATWCDWIDDPTDTTLTVGIVHKGGDRVFFTTPGHLQTAAAADLLTRLPQAPNAQSFAILSGGFLMPEIMGATPELLQALKTRGWQTAIDPGWPPEGWTNPVRQAFAEWLALSDFALINAEEAKAFTGAMDDETAIDSLAATIRPGQILVVKRGADGATALTGERWVHANAPEVTVIDTVGAGDTFNAAFLAALSRGEALQQALEAGVQTAARAISTFPRRYA